MHRHFRFNHPFLNYFSTLGLRGQSITILFEFDKLPGMLFCFVLGSNLIGQRITQRNIGEGWRIGKAQRTQDILSGFADIGLFGIYSGGEGDQILKAFVLDSFELINGNGKIGLNFNQSARGEQKQAHYLLGILSCFFCAFPVSTVE